jgi:protein-disulfide isomerase
MLLNINQAGLNRSGSLWRMVSAVAGAALVCIALTAPRALADDPNAVVATVGNHKISEKDLDAKVQPQVAQMRAQLEKRVDDIIADKSFDLRRETLEKMTDDYLVQQAAKKDKMSVDAYVKQETSGKNAVSETDAKKYFDQNKGNSQIQFDQIKPQLIAMLSRQAMLDRLRKDEPVKILLEPKRVAVNSAGHPAQGPKDAPVTIVEFADFQCPYCKASEATVKQLQTKYGDKIRLVHMDYPLPFHSHAMDAAKAARCANEQGKFWPYREALFSDQSKLAPADLKATAAKLGMNSDKFNACFDSAKYDTQIKADQAAGEKLGVDGTPAFFIDGRPLTGAQPLPKFSELIDDELANGNGSTKQASAQ